MYLLEITNETQEALNQGIGEIAKYIIIAVIIAAVLGTGYWYIEKKVLKAADNIKLKLDKRMPYYQKPLLSDYELRFYRVLKPICDKNKITIMSKIRLADVINVQKGFSKKEYLKFFDRIKSKHFDFVLCSENDLSVIAIIELDDRSHYRPEAKENDEFKNKICEIVGYEIIRITDISKTEKILALKGIID